jgi:hypothetical protein
MSPLLIFSNRIGVTYRNPGYGPNSLVICQNSICRFSVELVTQAMDEQEDWFNVDDEGFQEKIREDKNLLNFTDKALVVFWKLYCLALPTLICLVN